MLGAMKKQVFEPNGKYKSSWAVIFGRFFLAKSISPPARHRIESS
jgi:hypothetical protein